MLYPRFSETRTIIEMNGMWKFRADMSPSRNEGFIKSGTHSHCRRQEMLFLCQVFVPVEWQQKRVVLRFDSAHYNTIVWVNSQEVLRHVGGHLPFEVQLKSSLNINGANRLTVAVNNTLTPSTLPPGTIHYMKDTNRYPPGYFVQDISFDFFNYAGIHRSVKLYTTPTDYIDDITIVTDVKGSDGIVDYLIAGGGPTNGTTIEVEVLDADGIAVATGHKQNEQMIIHNVNLWWPFGMSKKPTAYMYTLKVTMTSDAGIDVYRQPFGVRTVKVTSTQLLINNKPFYCHGVPKHEDSDIRGKGLDYALIAKDFNLLKWLGATCIRTSHYPYAEEIMDQCDQQGIAVIVESPGVGITSVAYFGNASLSHHLEVMNEMVRRDKNRPAVIIWSVANEPLVTVPQAEHYFNSVIMHTKNLDPTRPVTFVAAVGPDGDYATKYVDILCINRYFAWYHDCGHTEVIQKQVEYDMNKWREHHNIPIIVTEYGADTVAGLHQSPSYVFTEEYQVEFLSEYHAAFDKMRKKFLVGEMVWNFADFMTKEDITRVVGNRKGLFTRQRQPKMSAHLLKKRYESIMNETISVDKNEYKTLIDDKLEKIKPISEKLNLDQAFDELNKILSDTTSKIAPRKQKGKKKKKLPVMNDEILHAVKRKKTAFYIWKQQGRPKEPGNFYLKEKTITTYDLRTLCRKEQALERINTRQQILDAKSSDTTLFYKLIRKQRGKMGRFIEELIVENETYQTSDSVLEGWTKHFGDLAKKSNYQNFDQNHLEAVEVETEIILKICKENYLHEKVSIQELKNAVKKLNTNKAMDFYGITAENFIYASETLLEYLQLLINTKIEQYLDKPLTKIEWKRFITKKIHKYWEDDIKTKMKGYSTLKYLNCEYDIGRIHPLLKTTSANITEIKKLSICTKFVTGTYILQSNKAEYSNYATNPMCRLCNKADETIEHFILLCETTSQIRSSLIVKILHEGSLVLARESLQTPIDLITLIINPYHYLPKKMCKDVEDRVGNHLVPLCRQLLYTLHSKRYDVLTKADTKANRK
ncbi:GUSB [Mytilus edulis]|uniref:Beta-glucuronidase n=1 Tax=Mytilus edulis TaxID=6550 RepID=A0A8S3RHK8_MYTED|nr:GUSB [Mytilus edulis]